MVFVAQNSNNFQVVRQPFARAHQNPIARTKRSDSFTLLNAEERDRPIIYIHLTSMFLEQVPG
jgi:hypothetical protein